MPTLDIDMFDDEPKVGDKIKVTGKVKSIDEDSGDVEVSYDDVNIVDKDDKPKKRRKRRDNRDYFEDEVVVRNEMMPESQTLDQALAQSFPNTQ